MPLSLPIPNWSLIKLKGNYTTREWFLNLREHEGRAMSVAVAKSEIPADTQIVYVACLFPHRLGFQKKRKKKSFLKSNGIAELTDE